MSATDMPPDLETYLTHLSDEWGHVPIDALVQDQAAGGIKVKDIHISLRMSLPSISARALDPALVKQLSDHGTGTPETIHTALQSLGFSAERIEHQGLVTKAQARLKALSSEASADVLTTLSIIDIEDTFYEGAPLLIEGLPGSGKSTTLQYITMRLIEGLRSTSGADEYLQQMGLNPPYPVPVLVPLRRFAAWLKEYKKEIDVLGGGASKLLNYLQVTLTERSGDVSWIANALEVGHIFLLLDGLDEIADAKWRRGTAKVIRDCVRKYPKCRYVVTSRPSGLGLAERQVLEALDNLIKGKVQPLDNLQRKRFVNAWYHALRPSAQRAETEAQRLIERLGPIDARDPEETLTRTPVTLVTICIVHATQGELPELRAKLYECCVQAMCGKIDQHKKRDGASESLTGRLNKDQKLRILQKSAFDLYERGEEARMERADLLQCVKEALGKTCTTDDICEEEFERLTGRTGLLVPDGPRDLRFVHKTFLEYLTARHICHEYDGDNAEFLAERLHDPWWKEVILLAVAHMEGQGVKQRLRPLMRGLNKHLSGNQHNQAAAIGTLGQAMIDLHAYKIDQSIIENIAEALEPRFLQLAKDTKQHAQLADRQTAIEAMGLYKPDPRIGWEDDTHILLVQAGPFVMGGTDAHAFSDEQPVRENVHVDSFRIGKYPVTAGQLADFVGHKAYRDPSLWVAGGEGEQDTDNYLAYLQRRPNHPATGVSWFEAMAYTAWLNRERPRDDGWYWRLPTEAEWEKAARGGHHINGQPNPMPRRCYPWGDEWSPERAQSYESPVSGHLPVGAFPSATSPYGTVDQAGNIWEWCLNRYEEYTREDTSNPGQQPPHNDHRSPRACRGGDWVSGPHRLRVSSRLDYGGHPARRYGNLGFRVCASPSKTLAP